MSITPKKSVGGDLNISMAVIEKIVLESVLEMKGVSGLAPLPRNWKEYFLKAKKPDCIRVELKEDTVAIMVGICVFSGIPVQRLAHKIQKQLKDAVQEMTGLAVHRVCVYISGISFEENQVQEEDENE